MCVCGGGLQYMFKVHIQFYFIKQSQVIENALNKTNSIKTWFAPSSHC